MMESWRLDVRGLGLRVWELTGSKAEGVPVICLHGLLDHGLSFARVAAGQPGRWLALDQRGFGGSDGPGPGGYPHFPDYVADLDALVTALGGPVDLVGHSMGGTVAAMYAGACPERVRRLAIIEGLGALPAGADASPLARFRKFLRDLRDPPAPQPVASVEDAAARLRKRHPGLDPGHARLLAEHGTRAGAEGLRWSFDPLHLTRAPYPFREDLFAALLAEIAAPTLLVWAEQGWYPPDVQERRAAPLREKRAITLPGGHMLPYDSPAALAAALADHLR